MVPIKPRDTETDANQPSIDPSSSGTTGPRKAPRKRSSHVAPIAMGPELAGAAPPRRQWIQAAMVTGALLLAPGTLAAKGSDPAYGKTSGSEQAMGADAATAAPAPQVPVIDRASWGATGGTGASIGQVDEVVVHHFWRPSLPEVAPAETEAEMMRTVERTHVEDNGWDGFGYSFVIFQSGRVYEGRGWGQEGAHTVGKNDQTIGIAFAIDGDQDAPTAEAWAAAEQLMRDGVSGGHLSEGASVTGHTDYAEKSCPGENVYPQLQRLRDAVA